MVIVVNIQQRRLGLQRFPLFMNDLVTNGETQPSVLVGFVFDLAMVSR